MGDGHKESGLGHAGQTAETEVHEATAFDRLLEARGIHKDDAHALVIDDQVALRSFLPRSIRRKFDIGGQVAEDGVQGLEVIRSFRDHIALVVSDVDMPNMRGPDMLRAAHAEGLLNDVPVVVMTGRPAENAQEIDDITAGGIAQEMLSKPFGPEELVLAIECACQKVLDKMNTQA